MLGRGFKSYRQLQASDCGVACVRMVARAYGKAIPAGALRGLTEVSKIGISLQDVVDLFKKVGMESRALAITVNDIYRMPCPAVVYWDQRHYVVLYKIDAARRTFHVADPDEGKVRLPEADFMRHWKGESDRGVLISRADPEDG